MTDSSTTDDATDRSTDGETTRPTNRRSHVREEYGRSPRRPTAAVDRPRPTRRTNRNRRRPTIAPARSGTRRTTSRPPRGREPRVGLWQPGGDLATRGREDGARSRIRRRVRLFSRGARGGPRRPGDRGRHDTGNDRQSARERPRKRVRERRVPPRRDRTPAGRRRHRRYDHLELRSEPFTGKTTSARGGVSRPRRRRIALDFGSRRDRAVTPGGPRTRTRSPTASGTQRRSSHSKRGSRTRDSSTSRS